MHIPDGFLNETVIAGTTLVSAAFVALAAKKTNKKVLASPMIGATAAFVIAAQMINFPVASFVSGHIIGGVLVAILLSWRVSILVMSAVLIIQALMFQDGGVAVLGANILNLGIIGPGVGYLLYRAIRYRSPGTNPNTWTARDSTAAFVGGWTATVVAAFLASLELWLSKQADLKPILTLMISFHALIGIAEGIATMLIAKFLFYHQRQCADYYPVYREKYF